MNDITVEVRKVTGSTSCHHTVEKGEKYLAIQGDFMGHPTRRTKCAKCGMKLMREILKDNVAQLKQLAQERNVKL